MAQSVRQWSWVCVACASSPEPVSRGSQVPACLIGPCGHVPWLWWLSSPWGEAFTGVSPLALGAFLLGSRTDVSVTPNLVTVCPRCPLPPFPPSHSPPHPPWHSLCCPHRCPPPAVQHCRGDRLSEWADLGSSAGPVEVLASHAQDSIVFLNRGGGIIIASSYYFTGEDQDTGAWGVS